MDDQDLKRILSGYASYTHVPRGLETPTDLSMEQALEALHSHMQTAFDDVIGSDLPTFGPQNEAGDISPDDYRAAGYNDAKFYARKRAAKWLGGDK